MEKQKRVLILDFGGQYNLLIARRVRECGVYCEIVPYSADLARIRAFEPDGIIFTGGPATVFADGAPMIDKAVFELGVPVLARLPIDPKTASLVDKGAVELCDDKAIAPIIDKLPK